MEPGSDGLKSCLSGGLIPRDDHGSPGHVRGGGLTKWGHDNRLTGTRTVRTNSALALEAHHHMMGI